jgi:Spy/CpxP family protein refolding chaperone
MNKTLGLVCCLALAGLAFAQDRRPPRSGELRPGRPEPGQRGPDFDRPGGPMWRAEFFDAMADRMADQLELDDAQQPQFDALVDMFRERMREDSERAGGFEDLRRQMREAREAGDEAKMEALREQMRTMRRGSDEIRAAFFDSVEKILHEDQIERLAEIRERFQEREGRPGGPPLERLKNVLQLSEEQAHTFDALAEQMRARMQAAFETGERPAFREEFARFADELNRVLDDEQREILAQQRERFAAGRPDPEGAGRGRAMNPREIIRAAKTLDLSPEQLDKLRAIEEEAGRATRESRRERAAMAELATQLKQQVLAILTPQQAEQFERALAPRGRGEREGPRRGRRATEPTQPAEQP